MERFAERLKRNFVPEEDGSETRTIGDQAVSIYRPAGKVVGLTFVLTAPGMPISKYKSIIKALTDSDHAAVAIFTNLNPNYRAKAERIPLMFKALKGEFRVHKYDMIGHSIGGKIALLTASLYDAKGDIRSILALDPVDQTPPEFTNPTELNSALNKAGGSPGKGRTNLSLESQTDITVTCTDSGAWIKKAHNGREIQRKNPRIKLIMQRNTHHMVYCDDDGVLSWKALTSKGTSPDRNRAVKEETIRLIKECASKASTTRQSSAKASAKMNSFVGRAKRAVQDAKNDITELGNDAQRKGNRLAGAASLRGMLG